MIAASAAVALAGCSSASAMTTSSTPKSSSSSARVTAGVAPSRSSGPPTTAPPATGNLKDPATISTPRRNLPDPFVLKVPGGYQLYVSQTGLNSPIVPTAFSRTFGHWPATRSAMRSIPPWATQGFLWSPDVRYIDGSYVMYFDSLAVPSVYFNPAGSGLSQYAQCIGVATSKAPGGPFVSRSTPLICDLAAHGAIDPRTFLAPNGLLYLDWKSDNNASNPAPYPPTHLYAQRLARNGLSLAGPPHLLLTADAPWQVNIVEAPDMVVARGRYFLFYSGSWYFGATYGVGWASCAGPTGPCTDRSKRGPFIGTNGQGKGPGEESLFEDTDGQWWILYSPWYYGFKGRKYRPLAIAPIAFKASPYVAAVATSTG
ncbi:MAG: glycoside hydrolase family 43 protein [Acidimicrobiales bacterium]